MKKLQIITIALLFSISNLHASFLASPSPYSFGPEGRTVADLRDFSTPKQVVQILPNRPVVATDSSGARVYYSPNGSMMLSISKDGRMSFSVGNVTKEKDAQGNLTSITEGKAGSNISEVKNEFGELLGYKETGLGGKTVREYDSDFNLTKSYDYGKFGKTINFTVDEMTQRKTTFDEFGRAMAVYDADGFILTSYQYEDVGYESDSDRQTLNAVKNVNVNDNKGLMVSSKDYGHVIHDSVNGEVSTTFEHSTTYYDREGLAEYVEDASGLVSRKFHYVQNSQGHKVLDYVEDPLTKEITFYENGYEKETRNAQGALVKQFFRNGSKLLFVVEFGADGRWSRVVKDDYVENAIDSTYDSYGNIVESKNSQDYGIVTKYFYDETKGVAPDGTKVLLRIEDYVDGDLVSTTRCDDEGRRLYTLDKDGVTKLKEYSWNGDQLVYVFDNINKTTEWFNKDKEDIYMTFNDRIITKNIYNNGQLIGRWDAQNNKVTILINERSWIEIAYPTEPTAEYVSKLIALSGTINEEISKNNAVDTDKIIADALKLGE